MFVRLLALSPYLLQLTFLSTTRDQIFNLITRGHLFLFKNNTTEHIVRAVSHQQSGWLIGQICISERASVCSKPPMVVSVRRLCLQAICCRCWTLAVTHFSDEHSHCGNKQHVKSYWRAWRASCVKLLTIAIGIRCVLDWIDVDRNLH